MEVWVDAQLPPVLATNLGRSFAVEARHVVDLQLLRASDAQIFDAARIVDAIVVTKDSDFVRLVETRGPPPRILWLTLGNVSNAALWAAVERHWPRVRALFESGEPLVEIGAAS